MWTVNEVLYYVDGDFMSRKHVERGMITLHPIGIPHGPHPGTVEKSIGKETTGELAVMVDTFHPLQICKGCAGDRGPDILHELDGIKTAKVLTFNRYPFT